ncbi:2-hydroxyacid dehydrogenase [Rhodohalobacter barkolensis]|uniref:Glyoxylate/hydroxypyruvate reductase A n=1 Tax=Rhodohalobacter barkolensis TaxID=2053187 RepID=A0A2N0VFW5_9BACT|nr:glyoxylate/hydroxypyruvate reductase A [Rhodohalobacter barkolensis]PKD43081.1 glyoxylate/hydroxypyruvate reductase A [Rhodohalobacter barkolensis]
MSLLLVSKNRDLKPYKEALLELDPNIEIDIWPGVSNPDRVQFAVAWRHPANLFEKFPNLKVISSLGAGVDHLLSDDTIPESIQFTRIVAPSLSGQMSDYILTAVLNIIRRTDNYLDQQRKTVWKPLDSLKKAEISVGVMGLGQIGSEVAKILVRNGFNVSGWSRTKKTIEGVTCYTKDELGAFLGKINIAICLLPLTPETGGILNLDLFKGLKQPAYLINAARGEHLVEEDLIYALDTDLIHHATLDVFSEEPLPESHPFWGRKKITITPHIASVTDPQESAELILENYKRMLSGMDLLHKVDREAGY